MAQRGEEHQKNKKSWRALFTPTAVAIAALVVGAAVGWLAQAYVTASQTAYRPPLREHDSQYQFINPLLACESPPGSGLEEFKSLASSIRQLIGEQQDARAIDVASVYLRQFNTGRWVIINGHEEYFPASLEKVPLMMAYFRLAEDNQALLAKQIHYDGSVDENAKEEFKPAHPITPGWYTVEDLVKAMIVSSDNNAMQLLFTSIDQRLLTGVFTDLGVSLPTEDQDTITVHDYTYFFRVLYNATYLNHAMSERALKLLTQSDFNGGLRAGVPESVAVAHKFGESQFVAEDRYGNFQVIKKELHDCGIIYTQPNPYLLCVMTKGSNFESLQTTIAKISQLAYQAMTSQ